MSKGNLKSSVIRTNKSTFDFEHRERRAADQKKSDFFWNSKHRHSDWKNRISEKVELFFKREKMFLAGLDPEEKLSAKPICIFFLSKTKSGFEIFVLKNS